MTSISSAHPFDNTVNQLSIMQQNDPKTACLHVCVGLYEMLTTRGTSGKERHNAIDCFLSLSQVTLRLQEFAHIIFRGLEYISAAPGGYGL